MGQHRSQAHGCQCVSLTRSLVATCSLLIPTPYAWHVCPDRADGLGDDSHATLGLQDQASLGAARARQARRQGAVGHSPVEGGRGASARRHLHGLSLPDHLGRQQVRYAGRRSQHCAFVRSIRRGERRAVLGLG